MDRLAAYAARYVAKNVVAAGLARQCQVQVAYAIGVAKPMNITVYTEGTGVIPTTRSPPGEGTLRPAPQAGIIQMLDLLRPIYEKTAAHGREEPGKRRDKAQPRSGRAKTGVQTVGTHRQCEGAKAPPAATMPRMLDNTP